MEMDRRGSRVARMAARNASVMAVREGTERNAIERAVIVDGSLRIGSPCNVEFGAVTAFVGSGPIRIDGQWRRCQVISVEGGTLHVRVLPMSWEESPPIAPEHPPSSRASHQNG